MESSAVNHHHILGIAMLLLVPCMHVAQFKLPDEMQSILKVHLRRHPQHVNSCIMCNSFEGSVHEYIVIPTECTGSCMMFTCMVIWNV